MGIGLYMKADALHLEPQLINDLLDIIHNAIIVINAQNQIVFANSRTVEMFEMSIPQLQMSNIDSLFMPEDRNILVANILNITRRDHEFEGEALMRRQDGTSFMGLISCTSFQWDHLQGGIAFSIHDITEMKTIEHSLRRSERVAFLGRLIDDISHQIRNPVMVIGGFARRLAVEQSSSGKVQAIMTEVNRLESLLDSLNKFMGLRQPSLERLAMEEFITTCETILSSQVEELGCNWISDYEKFSKNEELLVDMDLLLDALLAVVINACESYDGMEERKDIIFQIHYSTNSDLPYVINVIDHGVGISSDISPYILGHFYSKKTNHIGMGLPLVRRIVEEQRGMLTMVSERGMGSTFSLHLVKERRRPVRTTRL